MIAKQHPLPLRVDVFSSEIMSFKPIFTGFSAIVQPLGAPLSWLQSRLRHLLLLLNPGCAALLSGLNIGFRYRFQDLESISETRRKRPPGGEERFDVSTLDFHWYFFQCGSCQAVFSSQLHIAQGPCHMLFVMS